MTKPQRGAKMTEIIKFIRDEIERGLAAGRQIHDAATDAEVAVRRTFAGERIYIAGYPKQQRAVQIAKLNLKTTRELAAASGIPVRTVRRLRSGL